MLRILVAFIGITTIKPWKSYSTPCTRFHYSDNSSTSPHPGYGDFVACAMSESFLSHDMSPDDNIMGSTWHLYDVVTGHEIYNTGPTVIHHQMLHQILIIHYKFKILLLQIITMYTKNSHQ